MRTSGRDGLDAEPTGQRGKSDVAFTVTRMPVVGEFDTDPITSEPVYQICQRDLGSFRATLGKRLAQMAFAAPGQDVPVAAGRLGERVEVVLGLTLLPAGQVRGSKLARQPPVTLGTAGKHQ